MEKKTIDVSQAARLLKLSRSTIYRLIEEGQIPASRLGTVHCIRLRVEDLENYKQRQGVQKWA